MENPLPDDARIVGGKIVWDRGNTIKVMLESAEWENFGLDTVEDLAPPQITVHLLEASDE